MSDALTRSRRNDRRAVDAEGDSRLARREHLADLRPDRRILQTSPARGEGDRRRRGGDRHQGLRSDLDRATDPRGDRRRPSRTRAGACICRCPRSARPSSRSRAARAIRPLSRRQDRPNAVLWLLRNHAELKDAQIMRLVGTTKHTLQAIRERTHWNSANLQPMDPVTLGLCSQIDLDFEVNRAAKERPKVEEHGGQTLVSGRGHHRQARAVEPARSVRRAEAEAGRGEDRRQRGVREAEAEGTGTGKGNGKGSGRGGLSGEPRKRSSRALNASRVFALSPVRGREHRSRPRAYSAALAWTAGLFGCAVQGCGGRS